MSEDDSKDEVALTNRDYIIFRPYNNILKESIEVFEEQLSKFIIHKRYSDILKKRILLVVKSLNTPSTPFQNEIEKG